MVLLDEDPTRDVRNIKSVSTVVKNGEIIDKTKLESSSQ